MTLTKQVARYPLPSIPLLTDKLEIDVDALQGADLPTFVNYPGIKTGDVITVIWRGASGSGVPFDDLESGTPVIDPDPTVGMLVHIRNQTLVSARSGAGFYSYRVNGDEATESFRLFCLVGLVDRPVWEERLGVVQVLESHDQVIDYGALGSAGATVYIPHYQAMQVGDAVTLVLNGTDEDGKPVAETTFDCSPQAADLGNALKCPIRRSELRDLVNGRAELHYLITLKGKTAPLQSPGQKFAVMEKPVHRHPYLPALSIEGFSGDVLNPDAFLDGLIIQARCPALARAGDWVLCHWSGGRVENRHILALRLDASNLPDGLLQFSLGPEALIDSVGDEIELFFQIAREGWALSSLLLSFKVERARGPRLAPTIEKTTPEADAAVGSAIEFRGGAWVNVPPDAVQASDKVKVHWEGDPYAGCVTVETPDDPNAPLRFKIPAEYIAANMEQSNDASAKRFPVSYTLVTDTGELPSEALRLRIQPVPRGNYQQVICDEADGLGNLSIGALKADPSLVLRSWPFMAVGNRVTISVTGVLAVGGEYKKTLRDAQKVDAGEVAKGMVVATVPLQDLKGLAIDSRMSMKAEISFDDGQSTHAVPDSNVAIRS
ncbi:hypothetical protein [Pseudomonas putida]|uniref:hypothetical protein n=1 Tax=Pseudomonas putida TaxID=303 RepID=UPI0012601AF8|nr:hypothetical protein [Pseudomonas putida]